MKSLAQVAVVGLERAGELVDDPGGDPLVTILVPTPSGEQGFLLRLGIAAVRARAGRKATPATRPEPAPAEIRPVCSEALAQLVADLCRDRNTALLGEATARIDLRGLRLPPAILVDFAEVKDSRLQPAAGRVVGERGRWLAAHNPAWRWLTEGEAALAAGDRRKIWGEGALPSRLAVLRAVRAEDPSQGRAWLEAVWKEEKAGTREELLGALESGLSLDDEPFLTRALSDRAGPVRTLAASMLARLEGSALAARMRTRAEAIVGYEPPSSGGRGLLGAIKARLGGSTTGTLTINPPEAFGEDWARDGLVEKPPAGTGEKAFWISQILALVPPAHWEQRLGATPEALLAAGAKSDWASALMAGWTQAVVAFRATSWVPALWHDQLDAALPEQLTTLAPQLFSLVPHEQAESLVAPLLDEAEPSRLHSLLAALPAPWGEAFGETFTRVVERGVRNRPANWQEAYAWKGCLDKAALALPATCFAHALAIEGPQVPDDPVALQLRNAVEAFRSVLAVRKRIHEETSP